MSPSGVGGEVRGATAPTTPLRIPPHSLFKRKLRDLEHAFIAWGQEAQMPRPRGAAAREGIRYERRVLAGLLSRFGDRRVLPGPLIHFVDAGQRSCAIPDALVFSPDFTKVAVVEVKLRHRVDAFYQLNSFYLPIVRLALPTLHVGSLEVCCYYDPAIQLPVPCRMVNSIDWSFNPGGGHPVLCTGKLRGKGGWSTDTWISPNS